MNLIKQIKIFSLLVFALFITSCSGKKVIEKQALCFEGTCVSGTILDKNNKAIDGVSISSEPDIGEFLTKAEGSFKLIFPALSEDYSGQKTQESYKLTLSKLGYKSQAISLTYTGNDIDLGEIFLVKEDLDIPETDLDYDEVNLENSSNIGTIKQEE